jgi:hypothetical protein
MKVIIAVALGLLWSAFNAHAWSFGSPLSPIGEVTCSNITSARIKNGFEVCATFYFLSCAWECLDDGITCGCVSDDYIGYQITTGLKQGDQTDISSGMSAEDWAKAFRLELAVEIRTDQTKNNTCNVLITSKGKEQKCKTCSYCGDERYSADCTNVKYGRKVKCESAKERVNGGQYPDIFFPLNKIALQAPTIRAPMKAVAPMAKAPVAAPVQNAPKTPTFRV